MKATTKPQQIDRLKRVDFLNPFLMFITTITFLLPLRIGGNQFEWNHSISPASLGASLTMKFAFGYAEFKRTKSIFSLTFLTRRDIFLSYVILFPRSFFPGMRYSRLTQIFTYLSPDNVHSAFVFSGYEQRLPFSCWILPHPCCHRECCRCPYHRRLYQKAKTT